MEGPACRYGVQNVTRKAEITSTDVANAIKRFLICIPPISDPISQHCEETPSLQTPFNRITLAMTVFELAVFGMEILPRDPISALKMTAKAAPAMHNVRRPIVSVVATAIKQPLKPATAMRILYWNDLAAKPIEVKKLACVRLLETKDHSRWAI